MSGNSHSIDLYSLNAYTAIVDRHHGQYMASLARVLDSRRKAVEEIERLMQEAFSLACGDYPGSLRAMAKEMDLTPAYLSDLRHGRRKVSDVVVKKLGRVMK